VKTTNHHELLRAYALDHSEFAFQELVQRYVDLVYSAAFRRVAGDRQLAEDVTQEVFTDLARKAAALPPIVMLGGWLHRHTGYVASTARRGEQRRRDHERQAVEMNALNEPSAADWSQFAPVLDEAMDEMDAADRDALVLRYFERCELREVGAALGVSDDAAQKRVSRALEKLRQQLARRGITSPATALSAVIMANAVQAAPAGLAGSVTAAALATAAAGGGITATLLKVMTMTKVTLGIIGVIAVGGAVTWLATQRQFQAPLREANQAVRQRVSQLAQMAVGGGIPLSNPIVPATSNGFIAVMRFDHNTGPNGETHQVWLCRQTGAGFQTMQRWISADEFQSGGLIEQAKDPGFFDEVRSVSNGHFFSAIFSTENFLEYHSQVGLKEETSAPGRANMLVRSYRTERQLYQMLCGSGLASVTNISRDLGGGRHLVGTDSSTKAVMETHSEPHAGLLSFEVRHPNGDVEKSEYKLMPNPAGATKPFAELRSGRGSVPGGDTWNTYLDAKFYHLDSSFPRLEELHNHIYQVATSNHNFSNWNVLTNGKIYSVSIFGELVPLVPQHKPRPVK